MSWLLLGIRLGTPIRCEILPIAQIQLKVKRFPVGLKLIFVFMEYWFKLLLTKIFYLFIFLGSKSYGEVASPHFANNFQMRAFLFL
jgi:hypothetical protein